MSIATSAPTNGYTEVKPATINLSSTTVASLSPNTHYYIYLQDQAGNKGESDILTLEEDYLGYYADLDGDKNPDGIVFVDFSTSKSVTWPKYPVQLTYSYTKKDLLDTYKVSTDLVSITDYKESPMVTKIDDNGIPRFMVVSPRDLGSESAQFCSDLISPYIYGNQYAPSSSTFGSGAGSTSKLLNYWKQYMGDTSDGSIMAEYVNRKVYPWDNSFIASQSELCAIVDVLLRSY